MYFVLKTVHVAAAVLSIGGFVVRGVWMRRAPERLRMRFVRIAPHVVDTLFLLSGIALVALLHLPIRELPWLQAKLVALVVYIVLGSVALKRGRTMTVRTVAFAAALLVFAYIAGVAISKSPASWLALAAG